MKLLKDKWIPVQCGNKFDHITLQNVLCEEAEWHISLPRDDMEMACLQLLVCLTQVLFTPADLKELRQRIKTPLTPEEYQAGITGKEGWFDLDHPEHPFMQTRGVKAKELTEMAKLFAGLVSSTSSTFVNEPGLADRLCPSCAAIGLFNQANNAPSFGGGAEGGFKYPLRGVPVTTLIHDKSLRLCLWKNVLPDTFLNRVIPWYSQTNQQRPNWIDQVSCEWLSESAQIWR